MTDLRDKSQVISRSAEAELTKGDLRHDAHPEPDDNGASLDFSSSLSSIVGQTSPPDDVKGQVNETLPLGSGGDDVADPHDDSDSIEKQCEFSKFNKKFAKPVAELDLDVAEPLRCPVLGVGGRGSQRSTSCSPLNPEVRCPVHGPEGGARDDDSRRGSLPSADLLIDIAENVLLSEDIQPQKFQRIDDDGDRFPTASPDENAEIDRRAPRTPDVAGEPSASSPGQGKSGPSTGEGMPCAPQAKGQPISGCSGQSRDEADGGIDISEVDKQLRASVDMERPAGDDPRPAPQKSEVSVGWAEGKGMPSAPIP